MDVNVDTGDPAANDNTASATTSVDDTTGATVYKKK